MLNRYIDDKRYRGVLSPSKPLGWARSKLAEVERLRGLPPEVWPTRTALPESVSKLAELLTELGWDDLAALARCEEVAVYRDLEGDRPGVFSREIGPALDALRGNLMNDGQYENTLEVIEELLRLSGVGPEAKRSARCWRADLLVKLGRDAQAVEAAGGAVAAIRAKAKGRKGISKRNGLDSALLTYAERLRAVGRDAEAVEAIAEVVEWRKNRGESLSRLLQPVDGLSQLLVRLGRREEAAACITELLAEGREREPDFESPDTWYRLSARLLELGLPDTALEAGREAVKSYRERASWKQTQFEETVEDEDWFDHRYSWVHEYQRRREQLESSRSDAVKAGVDLNDGLLNLSAALRALGRLDEAAASEAEAAEVSAAAARLAAKTLPDPDGDEDEDDESEDL